MTGKLFQITDEAGSIDHIRVEETNTGKGIFATRPYPATAVIGEITGTLIRDPSYGSEYSFDLENGTQIEPFEPFRYVNHSCDANCEFDWMDDESAEGSDTEPKTRRAFLSALRDIQADEQLTIEYNWPANCAIPCDCRSPLCRGWVVADYELGKLITSRSNEAPSSQMTKLSKATPILRIFDEEKAREFYLDYLGFSIVFEHRFQDDMPLYMGIIRDHVTIHLTEHHGDACPGSAVRIQIDDATEFHAELTSKKYRFLNPGIEDQPWGSREVCVQDPFGNRLNFFQDTTNQA